jgi:hypothetical protein
MEKKHSYFLKISGSIAIGKQREFQQTVQFIFNHLPADCVIHNLALDLHVSNLYHLFTLWETEQSLQAFRSSNEFELLKGAFQTLGVYNGALTGKWADVQLFDLNHLDA